MNTNWQEKRLSDVCSVITDGAHKSPATTPSGMPMASVKDLTRFGINYESARKISFADFEELKRSGCCPLPKDVLIAKDGNSALETVCVHEDNRDICLLSSVAIFRASDELDPYFLRYFLESPETKYVLKGGYISGSAIPRVVLRDFKMLPIFLPEKAEQEAISTILKALDDKIELNRKSNETLEGIAKALFKSWFVDFDPARAKAEGRPTGLPDEISELFPDSFDESELGEVPSGWTLVPLDKIANYLNGLALQKFPPTGDQTDLPVIKIAQLRKGNTIDSDKCSNELANEYVIKDGDILFSWSGSLLVDIWVGGIGALNQHLFKVTSNDFEKWFFYWWTKRHLEEFQAIAKSKATTMGHIQRKHLSEAMVLSPPQEVLMWMNQIFSPILSQQIHGRLQSRTLTSVRDALLPKLISGELRVPDTEKMLEEVGI